MKIKNVLLMGLSLVLVAVIAIGGTVAYLTDTDSDVNVMTLGNVKIAQHEYERKVNDDGTYATIDTVRGTSYELVDFTQAKPLLPTTCENPALLNWDETNVYFAQLADGEVKEGDMHYYGSMSVFPAELTNVQDKFVFVENTGKTDAYVRTIIALEAGSCTVAEWDALIKTSANGFWTYTFLQNTVEIDGNNYVIMVCDYTGSGVSGNNGRHPDGIVHPGDYTYNNLAQVYMTSKATNEDVEALDGNDNGTLDILVVSQAVQADGFADAKTALNAGFGEITATNHPWASSTAAVEVDSADELATALAAGNDVKLTADVAIEDTLTVVGTSVLDLNGKKLTMNGEGREYAIDNYGTLTVKGGTIEVTNTNGASTIRNYGTLTVVDATLDGAPFGGDASVGWPSYVVNNYGEATISNTTVVGDHGGVGCNADSKTTLDNVTVTFGTSKMTSNGVIVYAGAELTINGGSYSINEGSHGSCNTVRVMEGATYTTDGTATFSKDIWDQSK